MHPLVQLAKETIEKYVRHGSLPRQISLPEGMDKEFTTRKAGVFVSLKINGELRGCIGTFSPTSDSIVDEVVRNAVAASTQDPRFPPVTASELEVLDYSVDVLTTPEPVSDIAELDPRRYGIIVKSGFRRGLLLPDLEGVDTVEEQMRITMMKAGIPPGESNLKIERFEVKRYR